MTSQELADLKAGLERLPEGPWQKLILPGADKEQYVPVLAQSCGFTKTIAWAGEPLADHLIRCSPDAIARLIARLEAAEAGWQPKVRPLVWATSRSNAIACQARTVVGQYYVGDIRGGYVVLLSRVKDGEIQEYMLAEGIATLDEAKVEAQADFDARILSAILPPAPQEPTDG